MISILMFMLNDIAHIRKACLITLISCIICLNLIYTPWRRFLNWSKSRCSKSTSTDKWPIKEDGSFFFQQPPHTQIFWKRF